MFRDTEGKAGRLAKWEDLLNGSHGPCELDAWHTGQLSLAAELRMQDVVDALEHVELHQLADAVYSHLIEDEISRELARARNLPSEQDHPIRLQTRGGELTSGRGS